MAAPAYETTKPPAYAEAEACHGPVAEPLLAFTEIAACQSWAAAVRSDGAIDLLSRGRVVRRLMPPGDRYVSASAALYSMLVTREDGTVLRTTSGKLRGRLSEEIRPPAGLRYTAASAGPCASYLLRSDGKVERTVRGGKIQSVIEADVGALYTAISAGMAGSYLLRDDGLVDRIGNFQKCTTLQAQSGPKMCRYIGLSTQSQWTDGKTTMANPVNYLIRDDGCADRIKGGTVVQTLVPPEATRFVAASCGTSASYLLVSDGSALRIISGEVKDVLLPPKGRRYVSLAAGPDCGYLVVDDGSIVRTDRGKTTHTHTPDAASAPVQGHGCSLM